MGSSQTKNSNFGDLKLSTVSTDNLKERLNRIYKVMRSKTPPATANLGMFEYLWDLKELALMEGQRTVQVPTLWLEELEEDLAKMNPESRIGH